ncbi:MAG: indolepyruvate ferredoxin oxidoreductase family protein, partial [Inquilinus sp.]|nr:indolepyruvate ferredoxin oxidoreductase family protein [Inquilinus sp.]
GLDELIVVEEKRALIENQLKEQLYNWQADKRPVVVGKFDEQRNWILPSTGELSPAQIAIVIGRRLLKRMDHPGIAERVAFLEEKERQKVTLHPAMQRTPYFCSGCPHNTSTRVPDGSRALAGIGCHYMAIWMDRRTETFTQMGGEGAPWIGQAPFTETGHVFANLGDGTYFHSGLLAIRAAIAANVNITYKILYNDAVAMTGGQPFDGPLSVAMIAHQVLAEGVKRLVVVSDAPEKYKGGSDLPAGTPVEHRDDLDRVQRELREAAGVTVLIYDQTCAAEKRRRRKRGKMPDPPRRVVVNELVCEGCGDCSVKSNCLSVMPVETEFGRKRKIDQSSCNKDFSCLKGFCPSFVTVEGGSLRKPEKPEPAAGDDGRFGALPEPLALPALDRPYGILITGIGGTGVVTIGALLGMAAHLDGKGVSVLDQAGLAQKGGAVVSHIRIGRSPEAISAVRINAGGADLLLGCDLVVSGGNEALPKIRPGTTRAVINTHQTMTGDFTGNPDLPFRDEALLSAIRETAGDPGLIDTVDATRIANALLGDSIATNLFMLGFAYQRGLIPVAAEAIEQTIALNGVAVEMNRQAFLWGRRAAHDPAAVQAVLAERMPAEPAGHTLSRSLDELVERRTAFLTDYQNAAYAGRYRALVDRMRAAESAILGAEPGLDDSLTAAVARYGFKLMAYKDEYEVARLFSDGGFRRQVAAQFTGDYALRFHLAPPLWAKRDPATGELRKSTYGPWMASAFGLLAKLKFLRGTALDPFGRMAERQTERRLIEEYFATIDTLLEGLTAESLPIAVEIAALPEKIRGYGHVKEASLESAEARKAELMAAFQTAPARQEAAE